MTAVLRVWRNGWMQAAILLLLVTLAFVVIWWRGPDWGEVWEAFGFVVWSWIVLAFLLNVVSTLFRALSWRLTIGQALPAHHQPRLVHVLSSFGVGLFANVNRARTARRARAGGSASSSLPNAPPGTSAALVGTVFAHRLFDLVPATILVIWVLFTAEVPHWALVTLGIVASVGFALFTLAWLGARRNRRPVMSEGMGTARYLLGMAREGLAVLKAPVPLAGAILLQCLGWLMQLLAVYAAMQAFSIDAPLPAAGLVLVLMNIATIVPLWPGNVGLMQAAVALPLRNYGVAYATGSPTASPCRGSRWRAGSGSGSSRSRAKASRSRCSARMQEEEESSENATEGVQEMVEETRARGRP